MELLGVITGLEALVKPCQVTIYTDSQYVCRAFNDNWIESWIKKGWKRGKNEPVKNKNLWQRLLKAMEIHDCTYVWVKGHAGNPGNERCDELATAAADGDKLLDDTFAEAEERLLQLEIFLIVASYVLMVPQVQILWPRECPLVFVRKAGS